MYIVTLLLCVLLVLLYISVTSDVGVCYDDVYAYASHVSVRYYQSFCRREMYHCLCSCSSCYLLYPGAAPRVNIWYILRRCSSYHCEPRHRSSSYSIWYSTLALLIGVLYTGMIVPCVDVHSVASPTCVSCVLVRRRHCSCAVHYTAVAAYALHFIV